MWYLIGAVTVVLALVGAALATGLRHLGAGERWAVWPTVAVWLVTVADLVRRRVRGEPLEPEGDE